MVKQRRPQPGNTAPANIEWLIWFLAADVPKMTLSELRDVLFDVRAMARLAISPRSHPFLKWEIVADAQRTTDTPTPQIYRERMLRRDLAYYQTVVKQAIRELTKDARTVLHISPGAVCPSLPFEIVRSKQPTYPAMIITKGTPDEVFLAFDYRLLSVLQESAGELAVCQREACSKVFLKSRSDKEYCSSECGTIERVKRWRKKGGKRHGTTRGKR